MIWPKGDRPDDAASQVWDAAAGGAIKGAMTAWQMDLIGWADKHLGIPRETLVWSMNEAYAGHQWDGTEDPFVAIAKALEDWQDVGVESGTGTGKSFFCAIAILWFLAVFENSRVFTFAPKEDQLRLFIWTEIGKLWSKFQILFPTAVMTDLCIRMRGEIDDSWGARGYAVGVRAGEEVATKAAGMHATHMLIVGEETPGIAYPVIVAHENTCTAPHNIRLYVGNPDNQQDALHRICVTPGVVAVRISGLDHPNVVADNHDLIPGAVSRQANTRREKRYGKESNLYGSRVRGISPIESQDSLIKSGWIKVAQSKYDDQSYRKGKRGLGVDVANSESGDKAAIARGMGNCLLEVVAFACPNANKLGERVVTEARADGILEKHVGVDATGVGAGTVNEAKRLGFRLQALFSGPGAKHTFDEEGDVEEGQKLVANVEKFGSRRAAMYWQLRMDVQHGLIALPEDEEMMMDLIAPTWETRNGVIWVEPKEKVRARLGRSTNKGDAVVYWNWVRDRSQDAVDTSADDINVFDPEILAADAKRRNTLKHRKQKRGQLSHLRLVGEDY